MNHLIEAHVMAVLKTIAYESELSITKKLKLMINLKRFVLYPGYWFK